MYICVIAGQMRANGYTAVGVGGLTVASGVTLSTGGLAVAASGGTMNDGLVVCLAPWIVEFRLILRGNMDCNCSAKS